MRPPAFKTLDDFLIDRADYPDYLFRSVRMSMLRELREYIENLEFANAALERERDFQTGGREAAIADIAKHAMDLLARIEETK